MNFNQEPDIDDLGSHSADAIMKGENRLDAIASPNLRGDKRSAVASRTRNILFNKQMNYFALQLPILLRSEEVLLLPQSHGFANG